MSVDRKRERKRDLEGSRERERDSERPLIAEQEVALRSEKLSDDDWCGC